MTLRTASFFALSVGVSFATAACGSDDANGAASAGNGGGSAANGGATAANGGSGVTPMNGGSTADGGCPVPAEGQPVDVSTPTSVVGTGTADSCTEAALTAAIAGAGIVTFDCGADPVTITVTQQISLLNDAGAAKTGDLVLDGGGKVTLSGGGKTRILYQNTCDESLHYTTSHCNDQPNPKLVLQNITFADAHAAKTDDKVIGGGAVYIQGGSLTVINSTFVRNTFETLGPDIAGGALYAVQMSGPIIVAGSTFGGSVTDGNTAPSGGAIGSIGVSWTFLNDKFIGNSAFGTKPSGGNGGAIYNDGNTDNLDVCGSTLTNNTAGFLGGAIFYVSDDLSGSILIDRTTMSQNTEAQAQTQPGLYAEVTDKTGMGGITITGSTIN